MLDEKNIIILKHNNEDIELKADFKAFKKLNKLTGNAFLSIEQFANDSDKRLELLPVFIQAMTDSPLTIEEIENDILGLQYNHVMKTAEIVFHLLNVELNNEVKVEEKIEDDLERKKKIQK